MTTKGMLMSLYFGQTQSTTEETIDIIMLIPSNNNMITILAIKIQKTIKYIYIKGDNSTKKNPRWPPKKRPFFHG
jgi:hypothetical protein